MACKHYILRVSIVIVAVMLFFMLFLLLSCEQDGPPEVLKTNGQPYGKYVCEAGTLSFMEEGSVAPSGEAGYVDAKLTPEYIYLLDGRENNKGYKFMWEKRVSDSERRYWYIYDYSEYKDGGDEQKIAFLNFIWDREGWNTGADTVTIQGTDGDLVFKFMDGK